jgi:predicted alpha/beta-fold hydrolase
MGAGARPEWRPERMELADGDFVDLAHLPGTGATRVCLFHGLEGCIDSHYIGALASALNARGHAVTFMHFRGCSGEPNRLPRAYHSGDTGDIEALLAMLREREATLSMAAISLSTPRSRCPCRSTCRPAQSASTRDFPGSISAG